MKKALEKYKRKLTSHTSSGIQIISACFILLVGATVGYILGGYRRLPDTTQNNSDSLNMDENFTEDSTEAQNSNIPLSEQTDKILFDFFKYQDAINQIILDYYNEEVDDLPLHCEALMAALYEEEALTRIPGMDYADREVITKAERAESDTRRIRNCMAYRDRILYQRLGTYSQYKDYIFSSFDCYLNPSSYSPPDSNRPALYQYATLTGIEADTKFSGAFADIVVCIRNATDWEDSYPTPIEE